jgi:hypothetical protein
MHIVSERMEQNKMLTVCNKYVEKNFILFFPDKKNFFPRIFLSGDFLFDFFSLANTFATAATTTAVE